MAGLAVLTISIDWLKDLTFGQQVELVSVVAGVALLIVSHIARFREGESKNELVGGV